MDLFLGSIDKILQLSNIGVEINDFIINLLQWTGNELIRDDIVSYLIETISKRICMDKVLLSKEKENLDCLYNDILLVFMLNREVS